MSLEQQAVLSAIYIMNEMNVMCVLAPRVYVFCVCVCVCVPIAKLALIPVAEFRRRKEAHKRATSILALYACSLATWEHHRRLRHLLYYKLLLGRRSRARN